jgi:hypothetical protein
LHELLCSIAFHVRKIGLASAKQLFNELAVGFGPTPEQTTDESARQAKLAKLAASDNIPTLTRPVAWNEAIAGMVKLDTFTGQCPVAGVKLPFVSFDKDQRSELYNEFLELAKDLYATSPEYKPSDNVERPVVELSKFWNWLQ